MPTRYRTCLVACARWEEDAIVEWLLYHRSIGIDHVFLYSNDDEPVTLYRTLLPFVQGPDPFVTFRYHPYHGQQAAIYTHFMRTYADRADWISFLDIDEFLVLKKLDDVDYFLRRHAADADVLQLNWIFYGNNGHEDRPKGDVLASLTKRQDTLHPFTKLFVRSSAISSEWLQSGDLGHFWHGSPGSFGPGLRRRNVLGEDIDGYYVDFPSVAEANIRRPGIYDAMVATAYVAHFGMKSRADFLRRFARGVRGDFQLQVSWKNVWDAGGADEVLERMNAVEDFYLRDYWQRLLERGRAFSTIESGGLRNVAFGKPATQSSVCTWSREPTLERDAAGVVSGRITGEHQNHTDEEDDPWWQVDLLETVDIHEIRVFNRLGLESRARRFIISASVDGDVWMHLVTTLEDTHFGGADGNPFCFCCSPARAARYVRITLLGRTMLHLDQVEVYGGAPAGAAMAGHPGAVIPEPVSDRA